MTDFGDKTEQPTPRRRQEARARGQVARSGDLTIAVQMLAAIGALYYFGEKLVGALAREMQNSLSGDVTGSVEPAEVAELLWASVGGAAAPLLSLLGLLCLTAIAVNLVQTGFVITTEPLRPDLARLSLAAGWRRIFSWRGGGRLAGGLLKPAVVVAITAGFVAGRLPAFLASSSLAPAALCRQVGNWAVALGFQLAIGLALLALLDYGFQLWMHEQGLKMTRQEVLDELRHAEGDPQVKKRQRKLANVGE